MLHDADLVGRRLGKLREYAGDLQELLPADYESYRCDRPRRYAVERLLLLICECVLDILDHVVSAELEISTDSYDTILRSAREQSIISPMLFEWLRGIGDLRDLLAHEYLGVDNAEVYEHARSIAKISFKMERELWKLAEAG